jgi:hypothetical protein
MSALAQMVSNSQARTKWVSKLTTLIYKNNNNNNCTPCNNNKWVNMKKKTMVKMMMIKKATKEKKWMKIKCKTKTSRIQIMNQRSLMNYTLIWKWREKKTRMIKMRMRRTSTSRWA